MFENDDPFQKLCLQAAIACGDDVAAIERFVAERIADLGAATQATIKRDVERLLAFRPPSHPTAKPH